MTAPIEMLRLVNGYRISQAIHVAVVLNLPDRIGDGPRAAADLATEIHCHPRSLYRLLRALATIGVFQELENERFCATELSDSLRTDVPQSVAGWAAYIGRPAYWQAWSALLHSVRTGESGFTSVHGQNVWEYRAQRPQDGAVFDAAMTSLSRQVAESVLDAYDFGRFGEVVDVGGGRGAFMAAMLSRWPDLHAMVFDRPHVVAGAPELLARAAVGQRCRVVAGDFFESVPSGADAYVLKNIVHDWSDDHTVQILRNCRSAASDNATLLIVERVIQGPNQGSVVAFSDLNMLVAPGGQERTEAEYATLLKVAGFHLNRIIPTDGDVSVLEARTSDAP
jgi:hypothetical protein